MNDKQTPQRKWNVTLVRTYDAIHEVLQGYVDETQLEAATLDVLLNIAEKGIGGTQSYFPKADKIKIAGRDRTIWRQFNGRNKTALALHYQLSERQIENIITEQRAINVAQSQAKLF